MDHESIAEVTRVYTVSGRQVLLLVATIITTFGTIIVAYYNNRPDTSDRWYGYQGRANQAAIVKIRKDYDKHIENSAKTVNEIVRFQATTKEHLRYQDRMISDCMKRTGVQ